MKAAMARTGGGDSFTRRGRADLLYRHTIVGLDRPDPDGAGGPARGRAASRPAARGKAMTMRLDLQNKVGALGGCERRRRIAEASTPRIVLLGTSRLWDLGRERSTTG
jgi:hypothetical protein